LFFKRKRVERDQNSRQSSILKTQHKTDRVDDPSDTPQLEGYLYRLVPCRWKPRRKYWLLLRGQYIYVYAKKNDISEKMLFDLRTMSLVDKPTQELKNLYSFRLVNNRVSKSFIYASQNESLILQWISGIQKAIYSNTSPLTQAIDTVEINFNEIEFEKEDAVGTGTCASVYRGLWRDTEVAVKYLHETGTELSDMLREVDTLRGLRHPNIVQFLGACLPPHVSIVTQYLKRGSLSDILHSPEHPYYVGYHFPWPLLLRFASDVCKAMAYLHGQTLPIIHRDLKPENILVASLDLEADINFKVADFGLAKVLKHHYLENTKKVGTARYMAPEVIGLTHPNYETKMDVHSYAMTLFEVLTKDFPFKHHEFEYQILEAILSGERPEIPGRMPEEVKDLLIQCWQIDPCQRPSFTDILSQLANIQLLYDSFVPIHLVLLSSLQDELFREKDRLSLSEFTEGLQFVLNAKERDAASVAEALASTGVVVCKKRVTHLLKWVGTLISETLTPAQSFSPRSSTYASVSPPREPQKGVTISQLATLFRTHWFYGFLSRTESEQKLYKVAPNHFIIHFNEEERDHGLLMSFKDPSEQIKHKKISLLLNWKVYHVEGEDMNFSSVEEIVTHYQKQSMVPFPKGTLC
jgi:serine/threonine protein kinase